MNDLISRQAAIDALDVLCQEHRYKIPGKRETYSQYNEAWQDALDRAEGAIFNLPSAQPNLQLTCNQLATDTISRQAAIDAVHGEFDECLVWDESGIHTADEVERILEDLPSAPVREAKRGEMIALKPEHLDEIVKRHEDIGYERGLRDGYAQAVMDAEDKSGADMREDGE